MHPAFQKVDLTNYTSKEAPLITKEKLFHIIEQLHHTHHKIKNRHTEAAAFHVTIFKWINQIDVSNPRSLLFQDHPLG